MPDAERRRTLLLSEYLRKTRALNVMTRKSGRLRSLRILRVKVDSFSVL